METIQPIQLAFSCPQNWEAMANCPEGKFCSTCQKTVFDLTHKTEAEIRQLMQVKGEVCGRFYTHQVVVQKPIAIKNDSLLKRVVAMAMVGLGLTAFKGVVYAQNSNSVKIQEKKDSSQYIFGVISEVMPRYKHGDQAGMQRFIQRNLRNPEIINGRLITTFIIDTTGKPLDIQILKSLSKKADQEAIRLVNLLEFEPGTQMGKKVPVRYILPIQFYDIMTPKKKQ